MNQTVIVILILAVTLFFTVRWIVRTAKGRGGCGCSCRDCPHSAACSRKAKE